MRSSFSDFWAHYRRYNQKILLTCYLIDFQEILSRLERWGRWYVWFKSEQVVWNLVRTGRYLYQFYSSLTFTAPWCSPCRNMFEEKHICLYQHLLLCSSFNFILAYGNLLKGKNKKKNNDMQDAQPVLKTTKSSSGGGGGIFGHRSSKSQDAQNNNNNNNHTTTTSTTVNNDIATSTSTITTLRPPPNNHSNTLESSNVTEEAGAEGVNPEDDSFTSRLRKKLHIRRPSREERPVEH